LTRHHHVIRHETGKVQMAGGMTLLRLSPGLSILIGAFAIGALFALLVMGVFLLAAILIGLAFFARGYARRLILRHYHAHPRRRGDD